MVLIAALTQFLIYYMEYSTLVLEDGVKASAVVPFGQYMDIVLTKAHYRIGRAAHDTGEVGEAGYWMAVVQLIGFMLGGVFVFLALQGRSTCAACKKYFRPLVKKIKSFGNTDDLAAYYDVLFQHPVDSSEFADMIGSAHKVAKIEKGTFNLTETLHGCPDCKSQIITHSLQVFNGQDWKDIDDLKRRVNMPEGYNLVPVFKTT